ncbi:BRCT domain-containing protein [Angomonas deanei]|nr:BRCT domain-containing protein [Angomonas deanei]|eukprot:EPY19009.1 BRCT domain-containing protein [Angomonas deanei]
MTEQEANRLVEWGRELLRVRAPREREDTSTTKVRQEQIEHLQRLEEENEALFQRRCAILRRFAKKLSNFDAYQKERQEALEESTRALQAVEEGTAVMDTMLREALQHIARYHCQLNAVRLQLTPDPTPLYTAGWEEEPPERDLPALAGAVLEQLKALSSSYQEILPICRRHDNDLMATEKALQARLKEESSLRDRLAEEKENLLRQLSEEEEEYRALTEQERRLEEAQRREELRQARQAQKEALERKMEYLVKQANSLVLKKHQLEQNVQVLQDRQEQLTRKNMDLRRHIDHLSTTELVSLEDEEVQLRRQIAERAANVDELEREFLLANARLEKARRDAHRQPVVEDTAEAMEALDRRAAEAERDLRSADQTIDRLLLTLRDRKEEADQLQQRVQASQQHLRELYSEKRNLERELATE